MYEVAKVVPQESMRMLWYVTCPCTTVATSSACLCPAKTKSFLTTSKKHSTDGTKRCNKLCTPVLLPHMQLMLELAEDPGVHYYYLCQYPTLVSVR
jgi:hypothetical protein